MTDSHEYLCGYGSSDPYLCLLSPVFGVMKLIIESIQVLFFLSRRRISLTEVF